MCQEPLSKMKDCILRLTNIDEGAIRNALDEMPARFRTKDLSNHKDMITAHKVFLNETHYHSVVGRYLSEHDEELGIRCTDRCNNAKWMKDSVK